MNLGEVLDGIDREHDLKEKIRLGPAAVEIEAQKVVRNMVQILSAGS